ncbi:hypothetical protein [Salmonella enterica]|uniref:hypothetical protein n=1 Tax=Salmonella enterica TaxID=28901 RepID=UPI0023810C17|nr:hypothetical protein [Salmonella enterica]WDX32953.1 hypothetical protein PQQ07_05745 [Salmonella enterica subsp. enterica serovar Typhimurium]
MLTVGIYGFNITKVTHFSFGTMFPTCKSISEIIKKMKSRDELHLTAFLELDINDDTECRDILFHLTAILSFIEQRPVSFGYSLRKHESMGNLDDDYPKLINIAYSIKSTGIIIKEDYYSKNSRRYFIEAALNKIIIEKDRHYSTLLHKNVQVFSTPQRYIDVSYYLLFSGLESIARQRENDLSNNAPSVLYKYLSKFKFDIKQQDNKRPPRSLDIYSGLRNALFHNGEYQTAPMKRNGTECTFLLKDYYSYFRRLNSLVILKEANFEDGKINWDFVNYRHYFK